MLHDADFIEGLDDATMLVREFLEKSIKKTEGDDVQIKLVQKAATGTVDVDAWDFVVGESSLERVVDEIVDRAEEETRELRGRIRFSVHVEGRARGCIFVLRSPKPSLEKGDPFDPDDMDLRDPANVAGSYAQTLRHNEVLMKITVGAVQDAREELHRQNGEYRQDINQLRKNYFEQVKLVEDLRSEAWKRDLQLKEFNEEKERKDKIIAAFSAAVPAVAAKLLGPEAAMVMAAMAKMGADGPGDGTGGAGIAQLGMGTDSGSAALDEIREDLRWLLRSFEENDQTGALMNLLKPEQLMRLLKIQQFVAAGTGASSPAEGRRDVEPQEEAPPPPPPRNPFTGPFLGFGA